jgi:hypothetical protein
VSRNDTDVEAALEEWGLFPIPASSGPVGLRVLHRDPDGGLCLLVRFPAGWERPGPGSYDAAEEVLFLAGELEMGGVRYRAGDYGWLPGFGPRGVTRTDCGALAAAWFSGPNRWTEGPPVRPPDSTAIHTTWTSAPHGPTPFGGNLGRLLRKEGGERSVGGRWDCARDHRSRGSPPRSDSGSRDTPELDGSIRCQGPGGICRSCVAPRHFRSVAGSNHRQSGR